MAPMKNVRRTFKRATAGAIRLQLSPPVRVGTTSMAWLDKIPVLECARGKFGLVIVEPSQNNSRRLARLGAILQI